MSVRSKKTGYAESVTNRSETDYSSNWSEWSDIEINNESWDFPKGARFFDPYQIVLPSSLKPPVEWKHFHELNFVKSPVLHESTSGYPDLITNNLHLLHSQFVRDFISAVINLQYCGRDGLDIENLENHFSWNSSDESWQGWFNIYSLNKAGKGIIHRPVFNPNGKYVVRIFHAGHWRRLLIDDLIPIDKNGQPLLPRTCNVNEIWPIILSKAMMKIAALSWTMENETKDCSLVTCLTGWINLSFDVSRITTNDQWQFVVKYAKHFESSDPEKSLNGESKIELLEKSIKSKKSRNKETKFSLHEDPRPVLLFFNIPDTRSLNEDSIPGITPCRSHQIFVEFYRDVPLDQTRLKEPLASWKKYRWLDWAVRRGIVDETEYFVPIRRLLVTSPLGRYAKNILSNYDGDNNLEEFSWSRTTLMSRERKFEKMRNSNANGFSKGKNNDCFGKGDLSMWADFNKMAMHLREMHLFYKAKFFKHRRDISDTLKYSTSNDIGPNKYSSAREFRKYSSKASGQFSSDEKIYEYQEKAWHARNEPIYLFVDSLESKFFLVNFSILDRDRVDSLRSKKSATLVIERHDWFENFNENKLIGSVATRGSKSMIFELEPGRHLLRIFISYENSYRIVILSDTTFEIGDRLKIRNLMKTEACRIDRVARKIGNCFKSLVQSFGTSDFSRDLKIFYQSYMPIPNVSSNLTDRPIVKSIHRCFVEELFKLVEKRFAPIDLPELKRSLRILFIDPSIGFRSRNATTDNRQENNGANLPATIVQSFFRMSLTKRYKDIHKPDDAEHDIVKNRLRKIVEIFDSETMENGANFLLREIVKRDNNFERFYPWSKDLKYVLEVREIVGRTSSLTRDQWIPILKIRANAEKSEIVFAAIDLFIGLIAYNLRVFDNDTGLEMSRIVSNVTPNNYPYRENGYTIFAYGWNDFQKYKDIDWILHLTTVKGDPIFQTINDTQALADKMKMDSPFLREISNVYVPNGENRIFKMVARVKRKMIISLRLVITYEKILTKLRVLEENGDVVTEMEGGRILILPIVCLGWKSIEAKKSLDRKSVESLNDRSLSNVYRKDSRENEISEKFSKYTIEAFVRHDSWPLTEAEWTIVTEFKNRRFDDTEKRKKALTSARKMERLKKSSRKSFEFDDLMEPCWRLQIITDSENDLEIFRDTSKEDKILELTKIWKANDPGRLERGRKLREHFLQSNKLIHERSVSNSSDESIDRDIYDREESRDTFDDKFPILNERTLDPPETLINRLPRLDLTIFMVKDDEEEIRWVKSDYDEETLRNQRAINVLDFEQYRSSSLEEFSQSLEMNREKYRRLTHRYLKNRENRTNDINEAYEMRQSFFDSTKNTGRSFKSKDSKRQKKLL